MNQMMRYFSLLPAALVVTVLFQNCGQTGQIAEISPVIENITETPLDVVTDTPPEVFIIKALPSTQFICEPFGDNNQALANGGLIARLAYVDPSLNLSAGVKNAFGVKDYFSADPQFIKTESPLFLSQINAPNQNFDQGFRLSDNSYLSNGSGAKLIEWFAIHLQSLLKLSSQEQEGEYELATISDDGSRVFLGADQKEYINNDGAHSAKMKCSTETVNLTRESKIPLNYFYNQGPRTEIANVLLWRRKTDNSASGNYKHCGKADRIKFWNPTDSSEGEYVRDILADGWRIVGAQNFELPGSQVNPCATQNTNLISKAIFTALNNGSTRLDLELASAANIKARLYRIVGTEKILIQAYDLSAQIKDRASMDLQSLVTMQVYSLEVLLEMPLSKTQVLNEVRFEVVKQ